MTQRMFESGLSRITHFFSWLLLYTFLSLLLAILYTVAFKKYVYGEDEFSMIFLLTFLGLESLFSFVWALRTLTSTTRTAIIVTSFAFFASYYLSYASDQLEGVLDYDLKREVALSPLTAIKNTVDTYTSFHMMQFPMRFGNWDTRKNNWSLRDGARAFIFNFFFFLLIAFALEFIFNSPKLVRRMF